jgi:uncharacterized BrkB/YihY/UPF0761 family membrane protein
MEIPEIYILLVSVIASIFSIASTAIGIQAFNNNLPWKNSHKNNFNFLVINLVVSIIVLILAFVALFLKFRS